uniref:Uncharacterized protein n=1 Tax=Strongyloides papillosus TaxID=174720 RepID=A0A0N5B5Q3_STREA
MNNHIVLFVSFLIKQYFAFFVFSIFCCNSTKSVKNEKQKSGTKKKKKSYEKKTSPEKTITYSATMPGKTEILLNVEPENFEKYINNKEGGGDEFVGEVVKALEKKKNAHSDMNKYKHWMNYIDEKQ